MNHLIIGAGEIGNSLKQILDCDIHDVEPFESKHYDIIHVAFPYSKNFIKQVKLYQERYTPTHTVIHSTVPVGTSKKLDAVHSPVTGVHPYLAQSIKTFTKFVGGENAEVVAEELKRFNIPTKAVENSEETEAGKLYNLLTYGINILIEKEIHEYCAKNNLNYDVVYTEFVKSYNKGYKDMGMNWAQMYELKHKPGNIGGHCVTQNAPLLRTKLSKLLK